MLQIAAESSGRADAPLRLHPVLFGVCVNQRLKGVFLDVIEGFREKGVRCDLLGQRFAFGWGHHMPTKSDAVVPVE